MNYRAEDIKLNDLISVLPNVVVVLDSELNFACANQIFFETFKVEKNNILGSHFSEVFDTYSFINFLGNFISSNSDNSTLNHNIMIERKLIHFKFSFNKFGPNNKFVVVHAEDQTKTFEKLQELDSYKVKTLGLSKMAMLGEMAIGLGFELSAPITVILNSCNQIMRTVKESNADFNFVSDRVERIKKNSLKIQKVVANVEALSRDYSKEPVQSISVNDLISQGINLWGEKVKNSEINLIVENIDPNLKIDCKINQISQILINLVNNSREALADQKDPWIKISAESSGEYIKFKVSDSGPGVPNELKEKIFGPFFTTKNASKKPGLGLSVSKEIVESHFGSFYIDPNDKNTSFVFEIPKDLNQILLG
jgi:C4-dicarboxylate-specific signal transduction histidine kinase